MLLEYAEDELAAAKKLFVGPLLEGERATVVKRPKTFKYVDGVERLCDMDLPFWWIFSMGVQRQFS